MSNQFQVGDLIAFEHCYGIDYGHLIDIQGQVGSFQRLNDSYAREFFSEQSGPISKICLDSIRLANHNEYEDYVSKMNGVGVYPMYFVTNIPNPGDKSMSGFQSFMNYIQDATVAEIQEIATELNLSYSCAADVWYLRTRSRWTQTLEDQLITLHQTGNPPNICDFG